MKIIKENLFRNKTQTIISIICAIFLYFTLVPLFKWLVVNSVLYGDAEACRLATGACLAFIKEKFIYILFGLYPRDLVWRPFFLVITYLIILFFSRERSRWGKGLLKLWFLFSIISYVLLKGGSFGLAVVESDLWGGIPLTLLLGTLGIFFAYPIGIVLALGRQSKLPIVKTLSVIYIELIRGVPLISVLFMASIMFPLFMPEGWIMGKLLRAQVAIIIFSSAYMAEVVRGGLQAIPTGQYEAAKSLGLNYWQSMRFVILPQALKIVIPPTVNTAIGLFKDTSLVIIIALFDLMSTTKTSLADSNWLGFSVEAYIFTAIIYFSFCFSLGKYSRRLEREFKTTETNYG